MVADRQTPFTVAGEKETLVDFLDYLRQSVMGKLDGLDEEQARWSPVPTGTSLLVLAKHLTFVERAWFGFSFAGSDDRLPSGDLDDTDTLTSVVAGYAKAAAASNEIVAAAGHLDQPCARAASPEYESLEASAD